MRHQDKVVVITGAGQGMGRAMAQRFAAEGARVAALDLQEAAARDVAAQLGDRALGLGCDVADAASVRAAFEAIQQAFGRVDVLVNSAGTGAMDSFPEVPDENWARVIGVNLTGTFLCCREAVRLMQKGSQGGVLINVSSTAIATGEGPAHYCATKAGVVGLTRSIARELAPQGIRANVLVPGPTNTPMMADIPDEWRDQMIAAIPLGRMAEPEDLAGVASFLASDDAAYMTGQNVSVNGGMAFL
ncbi:SDR family NAD(P)-dependent oxidoreductase [Halomonas sp. E14]|uniref:SDR family NAD(P)-dependent oxidoreductase n=1 Tax=Halomonas sp. E14 TaxID=3397245 RepID=UPI00403EBB47